MLRGEITINKREVARYTAENIGKTEGSETHDYHVIVRYTSRAGYDYHANFYVAHNQAFGPMVLAAQILAKAGSELSPKPVDTVKVISSFL